MKPSPISQEQDQKLFNKLMSSEIRDDLLNWVLFVFPWGEPGTPLEHHKGPRKWQKKLLNEITDHIFNNKLRVDWEVFKKAVCSGRGIGKGAVIAWIALWFVSARIGATVNISANSEPQLKDITWPEINKWIALAIHKHWFNVTSTEILPTEWLRKTVETKRKQGTDHWGIKQKLWDEKNTSAYAGNHNFDGMMLIYDEASGIADPIWGVAEGFFTDLIEHRYWFAFSNGRRNEGAFFECFHRNKNEWSTDQIDARTVEGTDKKFYEKLIENNGEDSYKSRVEVKGLFPLDAEGSFISPSDVAAALVRKQPVSNNAPVIVGCDPARGGKARVALVARKGRHLVKVKTFKTEDTMEIAGEVITWIRELSPTLVIIDQGGLGAGVLDRVREQGYNVRGVNFGWSSSDAQQWANKRAEMWDKMKAWLKTGTLPVEVEKDKDEFSGPRATHKSKGELLLESKDSMQKRGLASPDVADALAITFAFPVKFDDDDAVKEQDGSPWRAPVYSEVSWMMY